MKTFSHLRQYLAEFLLEWEMFQTKVVEKIKIHILWSVTFFSENRLVYDIMSKNMIEPENANNMVPARSILISKLTCAQAYARASAPTPTPHHTHTRARACTHTHASFNGHTHTHTEICNTYCFSMATMVSLTRLIVTLYVHCLSCFYTRNFSHSNTCYVTNKRKENAIP